MDSSETQRQTRAVTRTLPSAAFAVWLAIGALAIAGLAGAYVNHDAAWYLYMAGRWLDGATLYHDVVDTNPPLIVWLSVPPVALARATGLLAPALFKAYVVLMAIGSLALASWRVRRREPKLAAWFTTIAVFLLLAFPKGDFGQREHIAVVLVLPYIAGVGTRPAGRLEAVLCGALGGIGFAIKPHFLAAWAAIEIARLAMTRQLLRLETIVACAVFVLYAAAVALIHPEYFTVLSQVREVYGGLNSSSPTLLRVVDIEIWAAALVVFAGLRRSDEHRLVVVFFAAATGFLISALAQQKGWAYHLYPDRVFLGLFFVSAAQALFARVPQLSSAIRGGATGLAVIASAALVAWSGKYIFEARRPATLDEVTPLIAAIERQAPGGPVTVLGVHTLIYPAFPAVNYARASWSPRQNSLWFLPGLYSDQDARGGPPMTPHPIDRMAPTERVFFDQLIDDLCRTPPRLLALEKALPVAPAGRRGFDVMAYLNQSPRIRPMLASYRRIESIGTLDVFIPSGVPACQ